MKDVIHNTLIILGILFTIVTGILLKRIVDVSEQNRQMIIKQKHQLDSLKQENISLRFDIVMLRKELK